MIDTIITHTSPQGDPIRTVTIDDTPYFVGKDFCLALGYSKPQKAMTGHCKGVTKRYPLPTVGAPSTGDPRAAPLCTGTACGIPSPCEQGNVRHVALNPRAAEPTVACPGDCHVSMG